MTYQEAIEHVRTNKAFYSLSALGKAISMNPHQFRQIVSRTNNHKDVPEKYREDFLNLMTQLTSVRQID